MPVKTSAGGFDMHSGALAVQISMGQSVSNMSAGNLSLSATRPSLSLATRAGLFYSTTAPNISTVSDSGGIRMNTCAKFADRNCPL